MKFEFATYTDITELYKKHSMCLTEGDGYIKFFICLDVNDIWLVRVIEGFDEDYNKQEGSYLLERNNIAKENKSDGLSLTKVIEIIKEDDFSNWDVEQYDDLEELIFDIDGGHGLN